MKTLYRIPVVAIVMTILFISLAQAEEKMNTVSQFDKYRFTLSDSDAVKRLQQTVQADHKNVQIGTVEVSELQTLPTFPNAITFYFLYEGKGEVFLPTGYRTQEGDGKFFQSGYQTEPASAELSAKLKIISDKFDTISKSVQAPVRSILERQLAGIGSDGKPCFAGDICGELWKLEEQGVRPWSTDSSVQSALDWLFENYANIGWSVKQSDSWEPIISGDQITLSPQDKIQVRGSFKALYIVLQGHENKPTTTVRRLRYLKDTAGGCNPGFDPFRRLLLTWSPSGKTEDGANLLNSHAVNIAADTSPTHFHPRKPLTGGMPQYEMYLVLDPNEYGLATGNLPASLILYPDLSDLNQYVDVPLKPGDFTYIPPNTGHRGMNCFVIVITLPGFKPHNELYLDADIKAMSNGRSPYNPKSLQKKNYENLELFRD